MSAPETSSAAETWTLVEAVVRRSGTSFYWAMRCLPEKKRQAMYGIYAFCREVDDIADGPGGGDEKLARLGQWRVEIDRLFGDHPRHPVAQALQGPVEDFGLKKEDFHAVIDGMEVDTDEPLRIADMDELNLYCDRVACAVGRLCVCVFGIDSANGRELAFALGQALQLTNILRDIREDAGRDRLYIPEELLRTHGVTDPDLSAKMESSGFSKACEVLAGIGVGRFEQAAEVISRCEREKVRPAIMMMEIYRRILGQLMHRGWKNLSLPVGISKVGKLWIALRYGYF
jgi:phytoene synthase|tara:strand:+ start:8283 stop:9143 length:861 start_codon:yes stop_codon:yes gene_type:complete